MNLSPAQLAPRCIVDFETRSRARLGKHKDSCGAARYAEDPSTSILCMGYWLPGRPEPELWTPDQPFPQGVVKHIEDNGAIEAHNVGFEWSIWKNILAPAGIPMPKRWVDTMATCAYRALPTSLDDVGEALNLDVKKDKRGKTLIQKLCSPRKPSKNNPSEWNDDPDLMQELFNYCLQDVRAEKRLGEIVGDLPGNEYRIWVLDQAINNRGVYLDQDFVAAALDMVDGLTKALDDEIRQITGGEVDTCSKAEKLKVWLRANGLPRIETLAKDTVAHYLTVDNVAKKTGRETMPPACRRALELRLQAAKASTKKLNAMRRWVCKDGRIRHMLAYHGASTGRWAGRGPQPQNFPRGNLAKDQKGEPHGSSLMRAVETIRLRDPQWMMTVYKDPMDTISSSMRGVFTPAPGKVFYVSDFSAVEGKGTAWLVGEETKLEVFRKGLDPYCVTAESIFGYPVKKGEQDKERQVGKIAELAFGYGGGVGAWFNFEKNSTRPEEEIEGYRDRWREAHPNTQSSWYELGDAAIFAVQHPGQQSTYREIVTYEVVEDSAGRWLTCRLPNDRLLWYYDPEVIMETKFGRVRPSLTYMSRDSKKQGKWSRVRSWGGLLLENVVQAFCRDIMVEAMVRVEHAKYPIVMTVHDEVVSEVDEGYGSVEEYTKLMTVCPAWAPGFPTGAETWTGTRYRKA